MSVTHYSGSRGLVEIATMPLPYASNALAKLQREREDASRDPEIAALSAHVSRLQEEIAEQQVGSPSPVDDLGAGDVDLAPAPVMADDFAADIAL